MNHLPLERRLDATFPFWVAVDADVIARDQRGHEERKALDVVPVRVSQKKMRANRQPLLSQEVHRQSADPRSGVENHKPGLAVGSRLDVRRLEGDAGGVAAVA